MRNNNRGRRMEPSPAFDRYRGELEEELKDFLKGRETGLYQMLRYQLGWSDRDGCSVPGHGGKRLRPVLCLATCKALGGDYRQALPAAAAVELIHNFSLVHDDIEDGSPERHDQPAVWKVWGAAQAINAGDSMHALARLALARLQGRNVPLRKVLWATQLLDDASVRLCEGQFLDLMYQETPEVDVEAYLEMVKGKTAALISCAMQLGAVVASGDPEVVEAVGWCGTKLGIAFQIRDDLLDLSCARDGKVASGDILERKMTFPVVYALEKSTHETVRELAGLYAKDRLRGPDAERVTRILEEVGASGTAQELAQRYCKEAIGVLDSLRLPYCKLDEIRQIARFVVERKG